MEETKNILPDGWGDAKEVQSNWFKFNAIGDKIKGTLINKRFQKGDGNFNDQWVYELKLEDGNIWNVAVSTKKSGTIQRLNSCKMGEIIGIIFASEGESAIKGGNKAKNLKVVSFGMDATYGLGEEIDTENTSEELPAFGN